MIILMMISLLGLQNHHIIECDIWSQSAADISITYELIIVVMIDDLLVTPHYKNDQR